jgi:hypothetical protein
MKKLNRIKAIAITIVLAFTQATMAQDEQILLEDNEIKTTINSISVQLQRNYVFPEIADRMISELKSNYEKGRYDEVPDALMFSEMLTTDLQSISNDKHLRVVFDPERIARQNQTISTEDSLFKVQRKRKAMARNNFGFEEIKIFDGNIGYLNIKNFYYPENGGPTAIAAMNFLSNTEAIIIDLRFNQGGSSEMVQLISSYLFDEEPVHLNSLYWRPTDKMTQTWTLPYVQGKRNPDADIYILTSSMTFSAAEEFSYNLKNLERATIIGETTGGGAHPGDYQVATDRFMVFVPSGRAINPITLDNWEGVGVKPHFEVNADKALLVGKIKAYEGLMNKSKEPRAIAFYEWTLEELYVQNQPVSLDEKTKKSYVGSYGVRKISLENGTLFYQRNGGRKFELVALSQHDFMLKDNLDFRIRFLFEDNKVKAIQGRYFGGRTDLSEKNK